MNLNSFSLLLSVVCVLFSEWIWRFQFYSLGLFSTFFSRLFLVALWMREFLNEMSAFLSIFWPAAFNFIAVLISLFHASGGERQWDVAEEESKTFVWLFNAPLGVFVYLYAYRSVSMQRRCHCHCCRLHWLSYTSIVFITVHSSWLTISFDNLLKLTTSVV